MNDLRKDVDNILNPPKEISVGDTVQFVGTLQYTNSGKKTGKKASPCSAVVKQIYKPTKALHPYLVKGNGVNGWVNAEDIERS